MDAVTTFHVGKFEKKNVFLGKIHVMWDKIRNTNLSKNKGGTVLVFSKEIFETGIFLELVSLFRALHVRNLKNICVLR